MWTRKFLQKTPLRFGKIPDWHIFIRCRGDCKIFVRNKKDKLLFQDVLLKTKPKLLFAKFAYFFNLKLVLDFSNFWSQLHRSRKHPFIHCTPGLSPHPYAFSLPSYFESVNNRQCTLTFLTGVLHCSCRFRNPVGCDPCDVTSRVLVFPF